MDALCKGLILDLPRHRLAAPMRKMLTKLHAANMSMVPQVIARWKSCQFLQGSMGLAYDDQRNILTLLFGLDASL